MEGCVRKREVGMQACLWRLRPAMGPSYSSLQAGRPISPSRGNSNYVFAIVQNENVQIKMKRD